MDPREGSLPDSRYQDYGNGDNKTTPEFLYKISMVNPTVVAVTVMNAWGGERIATRTWKRKYRGKFYLQYFESNTSPKNGEVRGDHHQKRGLTGVWISIKNTLINGIYLG